MGGRASGWLVWYSSTVVMNGWRACRYRAPSALEYRVETVAGRGCAAASCELPAVSLLSARIRGRSQRHRPTAAGASAAMSSLSFEPWLEGRDWHGKGVRIAESCNVAGLLVCDGRCSEAGHGQKGQDNGRLNQGAPDKSLAGCWECCSRARW